MVRALLVSIALASCLLLDQASGQSTFPSTIRDRSPTFTPSDLSNSTIRSRSPVIATPSRLWLDWALTDRNRWERYSEVPDSTEAWYYWSVVRGGSGPFSGLYSSRHLYDFSSGPGVLGGALGGPLAPGIDWAAHPSLRLDPNPYGSAYSAF